MADVSTTSGLALTAPTEPTTRQAIRVSADLSVEELYRSEHQGLVRLATFLTGHAADAETIVHDAFVGLLRRRSTPENPAAFIRTAVINASRSWHRRQGVRDKHKPTLAASRDTSSVLEFDHSFDLLDLLTPRQRAAVVLRFYEMRTEAEIAELLGCRRGTVKSLLHRALATLRKELS